MTVTRGCGKRTIPGALYAMTDIGPNGIPWTACLFDPPILVTDEMKVEYGIQSQGVSFKPRGDVFDLLDWIGGNYYPFVPDYIEEGLRFGFSARLPVNSDVLSKMTSKSRRLCIFPKGYLHNFMELWPMLDGVQCLKELEKHPLASDRPDEMCVSMLWQTVGEGEPRVYKRERPSFTYSALRSPEGFAPQWGPGIVIALPISHLEVIKDPDGGKHEEVAERVGKANNGLDLKIVEE